MARVEEALRDFVDRETRHAVSDVMADLPEQLRQFRRELRDVHRALNQLSSEVRGLAAAGAFRSPGGPQDAESMAFTAEGLKSLREQFDLTQQELAQLLQVSPVTVTAWETGKSCPRRSNLAQIAAMREADQEEIDEALGRQPVPDISGIDVKRLRRRLGLTQNALAELIGVSAAAVTSWETGKTIPSRDNRRALAELSEKPLSEVEEELTRSGIMLPHEEAMSPEEIRQIRTAAGLSQRELAKEIGVSVNSVSNWETGRTAPRRASVKELLRLREQS